MPYGFQIWYEELLTKVWCDVEVEGHVRVSQGQLEVKLLRNDIRLPNLVGRNDQKIICRPVFLTDCLAKIGEGFAGGGCNKLGLSGYSGQN